MSREINIAWSDVLDLRVVRTLGQLINRRWNLGVGFVTRGGALVEGDDVDVYATQRLLCDIMRGQSRGQSCLEVGLSITREARKNLQPPGDLRTGSFIYTCHAGLNEVVAPIVIEGGLRGIVLAGGYLQTDNGHRQRLQSSLHEMGFVADELDSALDQLPSLSHADENYLRELVELLAEEIVAFQLETQRAERRQDRGFGIRASRHAYEEIIGSSRPMLELFCLLDKVADSESTVLVQGENGTGKELIARAIHYNSPRKDRRFVVQNCSAFNDNLLDSELFGHKKGAFTGAISDKQGLFEVADGGTFFLDEIGDMSASLQVKLLRVLQEGTFIPVGDTQVRKVDVRIIAATNRDLKQMVETGKFREDLYYRVNVININIPPLRERKDDIPILVGHFLRKHSRGDHHGIKKLSKGCLVHLMEYNWPGNIRELENEIERMVVLAGEEKLMGEDLLSSRIAQSTLSDDLSDPHGSHCLPDAVRNLERAMIYEVLRRNHWNKTRAAQELRISRRNLIRKVNKYKLDQRRAR